MTMEEIYVELPHGTSKGMRKTDESGICYELGKYDGFYGWRPIDPQMLYAEALERFGKLINQAKTDDRERQEKALIVSAHQATRQPSYLHNWVVLRETFGKQFILGIKCSACNYTIGANGIRGVSIEGCSLG